jgi:SAM-dependent methyltransferase
VSHMNDPALVREQYATDENLRKRQALYEETTGPDAKEVLWKTIAAIQPRRLLEVGGGQGWLSERVQRELGIEVVMLDLSPRMVELAQERGVRAETGDVQQLPFSAASFDTVVAAWMLYHVPDLDRGLSEIARVLEPGGRLVCNTNSLRHLAELRALIDYPLPAGEFLPFNAENGEEILLRHFTRVDRIDGLGTVIVRDRQKLVEYRESLLIETSPVPDNVELPFTIHIGGAIFVATK